ncbi:unnamed protein product [Protopolystoma xenopodis]|uniref:Uncharacterized protein n=1 Tax=Protopolystoma xenopodis TaxID=117903 RepID=A0A448WX37_9PLAT|nr:unnamed protein product [Protopolystoma xenopodis]
MRKKSRNFTHNSDPVDFTDTLASFLALSLSLSLFLSVCVSVSFLLARWLSLAGLHTCTPSLLTHRVPFRFPPSGPSACLERATNGHRANRHLRRLVPPRRTEQRRERRSQPCRVGLDAAQRVLEQPASRAALVPPASFRIAPPRFASPRLASPRLASLLHVGWGSRTELISRPELDQSAAGWALGKPRGGPIVATPPITYCHTVCVWRKCAPSLPCSQTEARPKPDRLRQTGFIDPPRLYSVLARVRIDACCVRAPGSRRRLTSTSRHQADFARAGSRGLDKRRVGSVTVPHPDPVESAESGRTETPADGVTCDRLEGTRLSEFDATPTCLASFQPAEVSCESTCRFKR